MKALSSEHDEKTTTARLGFTEREETDGVWMKKETLTYVPSQFIVPRVLGLDLVVSILFFIGFDLINLF